MPIVKLDNKFVFNTFLSLPESMKVEVVNFIEFLADKARKEKRHQQAPSQGPGKKRKSHFGSAKGLIHIPDDFNEPLEDFREYM